MSIEQWEWRWLIFHDHDLQWCSLWDHLWTSNKDGNMSASLDVAEENTRPCRTRRELCEATFLDVSWCRGLCSTVSILHRCISSVKVNDRSVLFSHRALFTWWKHADSSSIHNTTCTQNKLGTLIRQQPSRSIPKYQKHSVHLRDQHVNVCTCVTFLLTCRLNCLISWYDQHSDVVKWFVFMMLGNKCSLSSMSSFFSYMWIYIHVSQILFEPLHFCI